VGVDAPGVGLPAFGLDVGVSVGVGVGVGVTVGPVEAGV
jgi:hypothetical protein